jgi:murein DD-endopeptidase MepM/ murein hydrolase activator NlpD
MHSSPFAGDADNPSSDIMSGTIPYSYNYNPRYAGQLQGYGATDWAAADWRGRAQRLARLFSRLSYTARYSAATAILAGFCLHMVPWQADDAASTRLAALFNDRTAAAIVASLPVPATQADIAAPATATVVVADAPANPVTEERTLSLRSGQTISGLLQTLSIVGDEANAAANELRRVFDIRRLKAGQKFTVVLQKNAEETKLVSMNFATSATKEITVERQNDGSFDAAATTIPSTLKRLATTGEVKTSLYDSASDAGLPLDVMHDMMKMFAHAIDFQRDIRRGDAFQVMYDQEMTAKGDAVGDGQVIYASIATGGKTVRMYRYEYEKGQFDYFDEQGRTAKRGLLRTPVDGARMTSGFGMRRHPILGYSKMHQGVDFGASAGTPIFSAGDGTITKIGWNGSYGRFVSVRHSGGIETAYAHASGFAKGLGIGSKVKQGQVIAYVGSTGRSTGPHLHYEVRVNGRAVNPLSVNIPTGRSLTKAQMAAFNRWKDEIQGQFKMAQQGVNPITKPTSVAGVTR